MYLKEQLQSVTDLWTAEDAMVLVLSRSMG